MEKELNHNETRLFDLIESYAFLDLNAEDKHFVLEQITQEEYEFQRQIIHASAELEEVQVRPKPLLVPIINKSANGKVIPIYQALIAVASVIVVFLILWPKNEVIDKAAIQLSENDTIIQTKIIHDTFVKYVPKIKYITKNSPETKIEYVTIYKSKTEEVPKLLEVAQSLNLPQITRETIQNRGNSLKEDQSSKLIKPIIIAN